MALPKLPRGMIWIRFALPVYRQSHYEDDYIESVAFAAAEAARAQLLEINHDQDEARKRGDASPLLDEG